MFQRTGKLLTWLVGSSVLRSFPRHAVSDPLRSLLPICLSSKPDGGGQQSVEWKSCCCLQSSCGRFAVLALRFGLWSSGRARQISHVTDITSKCQAALESLLGVDINDMTLILNCYVYNNE